jgi:hypothetical protein
VERYRAVGHWYYIHHLDVHVLSFFYLIWHVLPYLLVVIFSITIPRWATAWVGSAALMCAVDTSVLAETVLGTKSSLLMLGGLLATLKLPILLPLGAALGGIGARFVRF